MLSLFRDKFRISKSMIYQMVFISAMMTGDKRTKSRVIRSHPDLFLPKNRWACNNHYINASWLE